MGILDGKSAWLGADGVNFLVTLPLTGARSPIIELIERVYYAESLLPTSRARAYLRARIHASGPASITDRETVRVAAKRMTAPSPEAVPDAEATDTVLLPETPPGPSFEIPEVALGSRIDRREIPAFLERLKAETNRTTAKWASDRAVSTLLVDASERVLAAAWNTNAVIRTRHAEWNLCASLPGKIPAGATLYVSLKPCRMCAAKIWESAENPAALTVIYLEDDPGPLAQGTMLDARSPARRRYLGIDHPLFGREVSRLGI